MRPALLEHAAELRAILEADTERLRVLELVRSLELPDCWVGAGFLRSAVWDAMHGRAPTRPSCDVDVVWFDRDRTDPDTDLRQEAYLRELDGSLAWSVKNQARMHLHNGDAPYASTAEAMWYWPETATAVAARLTEAGCLEFTAPHGLSDLFALLVRATPHFAEPKHHLVLERVRGKGWLQMCPRLTLLSASEPVLLC